MKRNSAGANEIKSGVQSKALAWHSSEKSCVQAQWGEKVGLLINFNVFHLRDGIKRMVNNL
jgi:hypothetical protein